MSATPHVQHNNKANTSLLGVLSYARQLPSQVSYVTLIMALLMGVFLAMLTSEDSPVMSFWQDNVTAVSNTYSAPLGSTLLVRLLSDDKLNHHAMIDVVFLTHDEEQIERIKASRAELNRSLVELVSGTSYRDLGSIEGKKRLRENARVRANEVMHLASQPEPVDAVLFTNYLVE